MKTYLTRHDDGVAEGLFDSIAWALETHVGIPDTHEYNAAVLYGNEDDPERIEFYRESKPKVTDAVAWTWPVPDNECMECGSLVAEIIGCPDGAEICRECFEAGRH